MPRPDPSRPAGPGRRSAAAGLAVWLLAAGAPVPSPDPPPLRAVPAVQAAPAPRAAPAGYVLRTVPVAGARLAVRWDPCQVRVTFRVNPALSAPTAAGRAAAVADVRAAFARLQAATGIRFAYTGTTAYVPTGSGWDRRQPAEVVVAWVSGPRGARGSDLLTGRAAGVGGYRFHYWTAQERWTGQVTRGFVVLDARQNAAFAPGFGAGVTRGALLLHELGHVVGLGHVADPAQLMHPTLLRRRAAAYAAGDRAGLARVGRAAGCLPRPAGASAGLPPDL